MNNIIDKKKNKFIRTWTCTVANSAELSPLTISNTMELSKPYNFKLSIYPISHPKSRCSTEHPPKDVSKGGFHLIYLSTHLRSDSKEIDSAMNKGRNGALPANNVKQVMQASLNTLLATTALYFYDAVTISDKKAQ